MVYGLAGRHYILLDLEVLSFIFNGEGEGEGVE